MFLLTELLDPTPSRLWTLCRQVGISHAVTLLEGGEQHSRWLTNRGRGASNHADSDREAWTLPAIKVIQDRFAEAGLTVVALEDTAPMDLIRLGLPGRDEQIANVITQIRAMGELGIPTLCYNWMARTSWARTRVDIVARGGALTTGFDVAHARTMPSLADGLDIITHDDVWQALDYFLNAVLPEAEAAGVEIALHPDDPPLPELRGVPRIMHSPEAFRRVLDTHPSPANGLAFCQGNFALMTDELPRLIRELGGRGAIRFVHMRDVVGTAESFTETFHDDGPTDLAECVRAYRDIGFTGPVRPDHVPTLDGEPNDLPGYAWLGRLFAIGYIRGLLHATCGKPEGR
jgi:mannonate dehydratase